MAIKFSLLKVKKITRETPNAVSVSFEIPANLREIFSYKHGQYITVKVPVKGEEERRAYSISSSPVTESDLTIAVKDVNDGVVSRYMNHDLKEGDYIEVMPPLGNFTIDLYPKNEKHYVLIGGGSGITPLISIIKTILATESKSTVTLLYANRDEANIIYGEQLGKLMDMYRERLKVHHILSRPSENWKGLKGRINKAIFLDFAKSNVSKPAETEFFLCGPQGMMKEVETSLDELAVDSLHRHKESFTAALPDETKTAEAADIDEIKTRSVKVTLYGEDFEFEVEPDETVLTAAQREGIDPPFSCQIGACSTCRAKLLAGKVHMDERDSLTDGEIDEGYILTCQSHPMSDDVIIDYDQ